MKLNLKKSHLILIVVIALLVIPQTRQPIQIFIHKGLALISPSTIETSKREVLTNYNWKLIDQNGVPFDFKEAKGKVVFINFWATWCPPCIAEMPSIESLYLDYKDSVVFLLVSNEKPSVIKAFTEKNAYSFDFYNAMSQHPNQFETSSIPRTYLIGKNGDIVIDKSGAANWNSQSVRNQIDQLLNE